MAVYTELGDGELAEVARAFGLGAIREWRFVPQGSINTNVRLETEKGRFFARHTTVRSGEDLAFEASLLEHLASARFPAPSLVRTAKGAPFFPLAGGRVSVFHYLAGEELTRERLSADHLERLGLELAKLHQALNSFLGERANPYGPEVVERWLLDLQGNEEREVARVADELLGYFRQSRRDRGLVPRGVIHADLFTDNVKWVGDQVSAFFDFEMACRDALALDVAVTLNAWCFDGEYRPALCRALARGYQRVRPFEPIEREQLYFEALFGAVRFTASRIRDFHLSKLPPERLARKDFRTYLARARALAGMGPSGFAELLGLRSPR